MFILHEYANYSSTCIPFSVTAHAIPNYNEDDNLHDALNLGNYIVPPKNDCHKAFILYGVFG